MEAVEPLVCPFCGFRNQNDYQMLLHVEINHREDGSSPFAVRDAVEAQESNKEEVAAFHDLQSSNTSSESTYVDCPHNCGERIPVAELQFHGDLHLAEEMALDESSSSTGAIPPSKSTTAADTNNGPSFEFSTRVSHSLRNTTPVSPSNASAVGKARGTQRRTPSLTDLFFGSPSRKGQTRKSTDQKVKSTKRLGTTELGPYAHEKRMPSWLQRMLEDGAKVTVYNRIGPDNTLIRTESVANETHGLVDVLARLSLLDHNVARAFYCYPEVRHIAKMKDEGGFCGYRNIQMLISYIHDAEAPGHRHFKRRLPTVIKLQDMIERAWDSGYNPIGRAETGGIRLTRKYIGTSEAQAMFQSLHIPCEVAAFFSTSDSEAHLSLLEAIFEYFDDQSDDTHKVVVGNKPPIYFQHKGHSMTIVGVEVHCNGTADLIVFDPMFNPSNAIKKLITRPNFQCESPSALLKAHRRGEGYLSRFKTYEILKISDSSVGL